MEADRRELGEAVAAFLVVACELAIDDGSLDRAAPLFEGGGLTVGGRPLDSLAIAEVLVALEGEVGIEILGPANRRDLCSLEAVARYLERSAGAERLAAFERRWRPNPSPGSGRRRARRP